ncbi:phospholipase D-like domain-containing protein, partial [Candidatus Dependentiae bacterium]
MKANKIFLLSILLFIYHNNLCVSSNYWVYFSPKDQISQKLVELINSAQEKIYLAVYFFTDLSVAKALIMAKNRNLDVQLVTDKNCLDYKYNKIEFLKDNGIEVFVFSTKKNSSPIMHNKFIILDKKVWTGSYNITRSASTRNQENVLCTDKKEVFNKYEKEFKRLKRLCLNIN